MKITNYKNFNLKEQDMKILLDERLKTQLNDLNYSITQNKPARNTKKHLTQKFLTSGWINNVSVFTKKKTKIQLYKQNIGLQIQFGNHAQVWFDVLKLFYAYQMNQIEFAIIICLNKQTSLEINSGMTNFEDVNDILHDLCKVLEIPLLLVEIQ
jgi:hypothetical protein